MPSTLSRYQLFTAPDGVRVAYRTGGPENGAPVLMLHGMASRGSTWDRVAGVLTNRGRRVIVPDMRGHGRSGRAARYPLEAFGDDMFALLDRLRVEQVDVIGHSLGGHTALRMAHLNPSRMRRLVIEDAPVPPRDDSEAREVRQQLSAANILASAGMLKTVALAFWRRFDLKMARPTISALRSPMPSWWAGLERIDVPVLLLGAERSHVPASRQALLAASLPRAVRKVIDGGHRLHSEQTEAFIDAVLPFLDA